jgi:hypothetical protein
MSCKGSYRCVVFIAQLLAKVSQKRNPVITINTEPQVIWRPSRKEKRRMRNVIMKMSKSDYENCENLANSLQNSYNESQKDALFFKFNLINNSTFCGTRWYSWLRHCATSRKVAVSIPDGVTGIFYLYNLSGHTMALGSTQPLTEMSNRNISWR